MIIKLGMEFEATGNGGKVITTELERIERAAKKAQAGVHDVDKGFASGTTRAGAFADATGRVSTTLARSADTLGLNAAAFRSLDDVMDIAELGFNNVSKAAAGFNAVSIGVVGAGLAIGGAIGAWLNTFPAVQKAADSLFHSMFRFVGLAPEISASAGPIAEFSKKMGALNDEAIKKQVASMRGGGTSDKDIAKFYGDRLSKDMLTQLGISKKQLEVTEKQAKADEKRRQELEGIGRLFRNEKSLTEMYKAATSGSMSGLMMPGIATSIAEGRSVTTSAKGADVLGSLMGGGLATSMNLSWSKEQELNRLAAIEKATLKAAAAGERWSAALQGVALLAGAIGGKTGAAINIVGNIAESFKGFGKMSGAGKFNTIASGVGQIGGLIGGKTGGFISGAAGGAMMGGSIGTAFPVIGTAVGAVVGGLVGGLAGWIGGAKKAKEQMKEMKEQFVEGAGGMSALTLRAQAAGVSLDKLFAAKDVKALDAAMTEVQKTIDAFESKMNGLKDARAAAESLMDRVAKGGFGEKFGEAVGVMVAKVQDALMRSGLGFMATGALRESEAFMGAQGAAGDVAQLLAGMRAGGALDAGLLGAAGASAVELQAQAVAAAKEAGLGPEEATKAGFGAMVPLLREMLNASIASGEKLSADQQALLDEAKANGITILADPAIESVAVQKDMLGELKRMNGGGMGSPDASFASGTRGLRLVKRDMLAQVHAGEGMLVVPKDRMGRTVFRSFSRGSDDEDPGTWGGVHVPGSGGGGGGGGGPTPEAPGVPTIVDVVEAVREAVASVTPVTIQNPVSVQIVDQSAVKTVEGQRAFGRFVVAEVERALDQNSRGLKAQVEEIARRAVR